MPLCHTKTVDKWESIADRKIREAIEAGEFDNLPCKGKPIPLDRNPFEDPDQWMAHHLLRVNGFAPPWIEEAGDIDRALTSLRADLAEARRRHAADPPGWQRALDGFRSRTEELNRRILSYNLKSPSTQFHRNRLDLDREIRALSSTAR
jgi:DnaJ family protein C protein 28